MPPYKRKSTYLAATETPPIVTSISWKPPVSSSLFESYFSEGSKNASLKAACSDGRVFKWSASMGDSVETVISSESNSYHSIDYSPDYGYKFAVAGRLSSPEIYDEQTLQKVLELKA